MLPAARSDSQTNGRPAVRLFFLFYSPDDQFMGQTLLSRLAQHNVADAKAYVDTAVKMQLQYAGERPLRRPRLLSHCRRRADRAQATCKPRADHAQTTQSLPFVSIQTPVLCFCACQTTSRIAARPAARATGSCTMATTPRTTRRPAASGGAPTAGL